MRATNFVNAYAQKRARYTILMSSVLYRARRNAGGAPPPPLPPTI